MGEVDCIAVGAGSEAGVVECVNGSGKSLNSKASQSDEVSSGKGSNEDADTKENESLAQSGEESNILTRLDERMDKCKGNGLVVAMESLSDAIDLCFGEDPRNVLVTVNICCFGLLMAVGALFVVEWLRDDDTRELLMLWLNGGFIALTIAFTIVVNM